MLFYTKGKLLKKKLGKAEIFIRCLRKISSFFQGLSIKYCRHLGNFYEVNELVIYVNIDSDEHSRHLIFRDRFNFKILFITLTAGNPTNKA